MTEEMENDNEMTEVSSSRKLFLEIEAAAKSLAFDPEKISDSIARGLCEPSKELYAKNTGIEENPSLAMKSVKLSGINEEEIEDPIVGLLIGAGKLKAAKNELGLDSKHSEVFDGYLKNIHGAVLWATHAAENAKDFVEGNKFVRKALIGAEVVAITLGSAGCVKAVITPVETTSAPSPMVETYTPASKITPTEVVTTPPATATTEASATPEVKSYIPFSEMKDVTDCDQNVIRTDTWADYDADVGRLLQEAKDMAPVLDPKSFFVFNETLPRVYPDNNFDLYYPSKIPVASCARIEFAGAINPQDYARVTTLYIPYPTASGGSEIIPVAFAVELPSEEKIFATSNPDYFNKYISDDAVFSALKQGGFPFNLIHISPYTTGPDPPEKLFTRFPYTVVPNLLHYNEQQYNFSDLFLKVFKKGSRDPATLAALKEVLGKTLVPAESIDLNQNGHS